MQLLILVTASVGSASAASVRGKLAQRGEWGEAQGRAQGERAQQVGGGKRQATIVQACGLLVVLCAPVLLPTLGGVSRRGVDSAAMKGTGVGREGLGGIPVSKKKRAAEAFGQRLCLWRRLHCRLAPHCAPKGALLAEVVGVWVSRGSG
jgi:hypothetical protein